MLAGPRCAAMTPSQAAHVNRAIAAVLAGFTVAWVALAFNVLLR